jgi:hypothetical protein
MIVINLNNLNNITKKLFKFSISILMEKTLNKMKKNKNMRILKLVAKWLLSMKKNIEKI